MGRREDDDDRGNSRRSRDDDDRGSRGRDRDDDRGSRRGRDDDDDRGSRRRGDDDEERGSSRGGGRSYTYERRDPDAMRRRAEGNSDFDRFVKDNIKQFKPHDGDNRIRILPPTWKPADHHGFDLKVHYGVGADRQSYLCLRGMKGEDDPIYEAYQRAKQELNDDEDNKDLQQVVRDLKAKNRTGIFLVDRDNEKEGVQFWAMPASLDQDIVMVMQDKRTGEVLPIDDPENGYDVEFVKKGKGRNTEYTGVAIARRSSPLGSERDQQKWMDFVMDNPIPDILVYYPYDHIAKAFGGGGSKRRRDEDERDERPSRDGREEREERGSSRDRDEERRPSRDRDDDAPRRGREPEEPTWESIHDMTKSELADLIEEDKRLADVDPKKAKSTEDLADWICEELKIKKPKKGEEREERRRSDDDDGDRLARMRERRERD